MRFFSAFVVLLFLTIVTQSAYAYLGGFELSDGYRDIAQFPNGGPDVAPKFRNSSGNGEIWDIALYNAGQFGSVTGGADNGSDFNNPPLTGGDLWDRTQGNLQPNNGNSNVNTSRNFSYATAHRRYDRAYVNSFDASTNFPPPARVPDDQTNPRVDNRGLVITSNADGWANAPSQYTYKLDQYDWQSNNASGASTPTAVPGTEVLEISFWSCAQIPGPNDADPAFTGSIPAGSLGNILSFRDGNQNVGLEVGYVQPGTASDNAWYRAGNSGTNGTATNIPITINRYHRWDILLDMQANTVQASLFDPFAGTNGTTYTVIPAGTPTSSNMSDLSEFVFTSTSGVSNFKVWSLDDFHIAVVPEPASFSLAAFGALVFLRRLRRIRMA